MKNYRCVACDAEFDRGFDQNMCSHCGNNLEIVYDYADLRARHVSLSDSSLPGIWRYMPLLPVIRQSLVDLPLIGDTPLQPAARLAATAGLGELLLKDETRQPSASFKDRAGAVALVRAREVGARVMAAASTGNAGSSMACLAAAADMPVVIFVPHTAPRAKLAQLLIFGARVIAVRGTYDEAFDLCDAACERFGWFNRSTGLNPYTREGKKTCAFEIWEQLGGQVPDWVVVPVGDGNIISGIWKGFRELHALRLVNGTPRLLAAQARGSAVVTRTFERLQAAIGDTAVPWPEMEIPQVRAKTFADSISVDRPRDGLAAVRALVESGGAALTVTDEEIGRAITELARKEGCFAEPAAATAWAVLRKAAERRIVSADQRVVCLITGSGLKDVDAALRQCRLPEPIPVELEAVEEIAGGI